MTEDAPALQGVLGYLHFSEGKPDPRFQKQCAGVMSHFAGSPRPWESLQQALLAELDRLKRQGNAAFRDAGQAEAVLRLALGDLLAAYRAHHADLLSHQSDADLFQPFF